VVDLVGEFDAFYMESRQTGNSWTWNPVTYFLSMPTGCVLTVTHLLYQLHLTLIPPHLSFCRDTSILMTIDIPTILGSLGSGIRHNAAKRSDRDDLLIVGWHPKTPSYTTAM
jgi:hypothetical protein